MYKLASFYFTKQKKKTCFIFLIIHIFIIKRGFSLLSLCARESDIGQLVFPPFMNSNFMHSNNPDKHISYNLTVPDIIFTAYLKSRYHKFIVFLIAVYYLIIPI